MVAALLASLLPGHQPHWQLLAPGFYRATASDETGRRALALIPDDASVAAQTAIAPHLTHRLEVFKLDSQAPDADYVITAEGLSPWPVGSAADVRRLVEERLARGYVRVFEEDGWTVLRRSAQ